MLRLSILCLFCLLLDASSAATLGAKVSVTAENSTEAVVSTTESGDLCQQGPMRKGQLIECDAFIPMFTFNPNSGECEGYIYGGCGGSKNLFTTRDECESRCKKDAPRAARSVSSKSACGLPVVEGRCLAAFNRFAYDHGDSGGALVYRDAKAKTDIAVGVGLGGGCDENLPNVFVRMSAYLTWIEKVLAGKA